MLKFLGVLTVLVTAAVTINASENLSGYDDDHASVLYDSLLQSNNQKAENIQRDWPIDVITKVISYLDSNEWMNSRVISKSFYLALKSLIRCLFKPFMNENNFPNTLLVCQSHQNLRMIAMKYEREWSENKRPVRYAICNHEECLTLCNIHTPKGYFIGPLSGLIKVNKLLDLSSDNENKEKISQRLGLSWHHCSLNPDWLVFSQQQETTTTMSTETPWILINIRTKQRLNLNDHHFDFVQLFGECYVFCLDHDNNDDDTSGMDHIYHVVIYELIPDDDSSDHHCQYHLIVKHRYQWKHHDQIPFFKSLRYDDNSSTLNKKKQLSLVYLSPSQNDCIFSNIDFDLEQGSSLVRIKRMNQEYELHHYYSDEYKYASKNSFITLDGSSIITFQGFHSFINEFNNDCNRCWVCVNCADSGKLLNRISLNMGYQDYSTSPSVSGDRKWAVVCPSDDNDINHQMREPLRVSLLHLESGEVFLLPHTDHFRSCRWLSNTLFLLESSPFCIGPKFESLRSVRNPIAEIPFNTGNRAYHERLQREQGKSNAYDYFSRLKGYSHYIGSSNEDGSKHLYYHWRNHFIFEAEWI